MISNLTDLNAAIDWLERQGFQDFPFFLMNDNEIHTYRGRTIWRPSKQRRLGDFYMLGKREGDSIVVAPWVVEELGKLATVAE